MEITLRVCLLCLDYKDATSVYLPINFLSETRKIFVLSWLGFPKTSQRLSGISDDLPKTSEDISTTYEHPRSSTYTPKNIKGTWSPEVISGLVCLWRTRWWSLKDGMHMLLNSLEEAAFSYCPAWRGWSDWGCSHRMMHSHKGPLLNPLNVLLEISR